MRSMVIPLLRNEISKAARAKLPYFGIVATALVCLLIFVAARRPTSGGTLNAWDFVALAMQSAFADVGVIFIGIFAAMLIADETGSGTARVVLSSPALRREFYLAKVLTGLVYMIVTSAFVLLAAVWLGSLRYKFGDVADSFGTIYTAREVLLNFLLAFGLSWLPLAAVVLYGILISAIVKKPGQAIGVVIGTLYLIKTVKHILGLGPYLFTSYLATPWAVFHQVAQGVDYQWSPEIIRIIAVPLIYCLATFALGLAIFSRRDLNG